MRLRFTKMQGAGNDFVVLDATQTPLNLSVAQLRHLGDRRFGVGADQILVVERASRPDVDFRYRIFNNTGDEVEHCGNGARCFVRYVREHGLTDKTSIRVETVNNLLTLQWQADGRVTVNMNAPFFAHDTLPFDSSGLPARSEGDFELWPLALAGGTSAEVAVLSMGNPHAVLRVADVNTAPVADWGPQIETHPRFARKVNAGFLQVISRTQVALRVFERNAGETLACGTGACAAAVAGILRGLLDSPVRISARGGELSIAWQGPGQPVLMTGPAVTVFEGQIEV